MKKIDVLIVDDQNLFAQSLKIVLESYREQFGQIKVVVDGFDAVETLKRLPFDLVIMDVSMPKMDGIKVVQEIRKFNTCVKILMLSSFAYDKYVRSAFKVGANGYILKDSSPDDVVKAIKDINMDKRVISKEISDYFSGNVPQTEKKFEYPEIFQELTSQERKVLSLMSKGFSNDDIAEKMFLSEKTVRNYISSINDKLQTKDRFEALRLAIEYNIDLLL
jgi:DNA-binding NarL/FixJ family response regulator